MIYAQKNYPQAQGINGKYSIASIGCFLTAFCNLQADYNYDVNPLNLNNYFRDHGIYIDIDDGIRDDLAWDSITKLDAHTQVGHTVNHGIDQTAGWPSTNQSIVRFYYRSISHPTLANGQPNMIFHFCKVADHSAHLIVDSWDGQIKKSPYGEPTAWAEYVRVEPVVAPPPAPVAASTPPPPPSAPPAAPLPIPTSTEPYQVVKALKGYATSNAAINHTDPKTDVRADTYYIFNRRYNVTGSTLLALNVTKTLGQPGSWINVTDNVPDPVPQPKAEPVTTPTIWPHSAKQEAAMPVVPTEPDWRTTYVAFKDAQGNPEPRDYIAMNELKVVDYETKRPDQPWHLYLSSKISGTFIKDGIKIARPKYFADKYLWFGVPEIDPSTGLLNIEPYEQVYSTTTTAPERKVLHAQTTVDHIAEIKSILEKDFQRVFDIIKPKKVNKK